MIQLGILVCNVPSERYMHASQIFDDGTMYVYGGVQSALSRLLRRLVDVRSYS